MTILKDHTQSPEDSGDHLLPGGNGHADEQYGYDQRYRQGSCAVDGLCFPVLRTAHRFYRNVCDGLGDECQHPLRQAAGYCCERPRAGESGYVLWRYG